ncbi:helix-turn-helix domain-containing protein [Peribacillus frigoritolerans]|uniref:helix-turn-helix domain-containing protein n=1 Tax=Peribacillus frigoritolerans TaxID=450367 RepID=UPI003CFD1A8F
MTLGQRLKSLRTQNKWTLKEVASKLKLSGHSTYSNWEYERTEPDVNMLKNIAELYGVTLEYLMTGEEEVNQDDQEVYDLEKILKDKRLTWGKEELNEEEKQRAIEILKILMNKQKDT